MMPARPRVESREPRRGPRAAARRTARATRRRARARTRGRADPSPSARTAAARRPGTLTPLRSDSGPPTITSVSAKSAPHCFTRSRSLPSSSSRFGARLAAPRRSPDAADARASRRPARRSRSRRNGEPALSMTGPAANVPTRSFGPCMSASTPIGRPTSRSTWRICSSRSRCCSCVPWLKLRRNTSAPATNSARIIASLELAGPSVATIFA